MRYQQVLALCLLACCATALAREKKGQDYNYEDDYLKQTYDHYGYKGEEDKPECGPKQFAELKDATTCIDVDSGECVRYNKEECVIDEDGWCKQVEDSDWACKYEYKEKGTECRAADGVCDKADVCSGKSATCKDAVKDKGDVCKVSDSVCKKDAVCDGTAKTCPAPANAANGHPCKKDGLYSEAYAEDGKVAMQSTVSAEIAKKHGWSVCHRCFEGVCGTFKFEWWSGKHKGKKHGGKHGDKDESKYEDKEESKHGKHADKDGDYDDDDKWYKSKVDTEAAAKLQGYEDVIYCTKEDQKY